MKKLKATQGGVGLVPLMQLPLLAGLAVLLAGRLDRSGGKSVA